MSRTWLVVWKTSNTCPLRSPPTARRWLRSQPKPGRMAPIQGSAGRLPERPAQSPRRRCRHFIAADCESGPLNSPSWLSASLVLGLKRAPPFPQGLDWRGVIERPFEPVARRDNGRAGEFRPREQVESDPSWKQAIPYLLLRDRDRVFLMKRSKAGADQRLHDRYSIGVGGHVNPEDGDVHGGLLREWAEEIDADFTPDFSPIGVLNDDHNAVGTVHLGLVFAADAAGRPVQIRETEKLSGKFATMPEIGAVAEKLETWSLLLYEYLLAQQSGG